MKRFLPLLCLAGSTLAGMHGYNNCYLASSVGTDNLGMTPIGLHFDSVWDAEYNETTRMVFKDGFLVGSNDMGGETFTRRGDTLVATSETGVELAKVLMDQDVALEFSGMGLASVMRYTPDTIFRRDSATNPPILFAVTKDVFRKDSLYTYMQNPGSPGPWYLTSRCQASATGCNCNNGLDRWVILPGKIEESHDDTLSVIYYTSMGQGSGVRLRGVSPKLAGAQGWRADGSRRTPIRRWMPVLFKGTKAE